MRTLPNLPFSAVENILNGPKKVYLDVYRESHSEKQENIRAHLLQAIGNTAILAVGESDSFLETFCAWLMEFRKELVQKIEENCKEQNG